LGLRLGWGCGAAGGSCLAAAGGGHWLLVGSEPLPEAVIGCEQGYAASAWFQLDHSGKRVGQTELHGFIRGSAYEPGWMSHLHETGWHAMSLRFNW
jgi:hypothetical protein